MSDFVNFALFHSDTCKISVLSSETRKLANNHKEHENSSKRLFSLNLSDFENLALFDPNSCKAFSSEPQNVPNNHKSIKIAQNGYSISSSFSAGIP